MYGVAMPDVLPPLHALRVFEAAARHASFTRAAQELHVTQTAVSHQMRALEAHLGMRLFVRLPRRLVLTVEGQAYAAQLRRVFDRIADATAALHARPRREVLAVTSLPSFTACWLLPRLSGFVAAHPQIDLRVVSTERPLDFSRESVDLGIRWGYGRYLGLRTEKLMDDEIFPVCSPRLRRRRPRLRTPADLRHHVLLHDDSSDGWRRWLRAAGAPGVEAERGHLFNDGHLMLEAAVAGLGVALARRVLVERELREGRLVRLFDLALPADPAYYLVTSEQSAQLPRVQAFRAWLLEEISRCSQPGSTKPAPRRSGPRQ